jgi:RNA polymerase sigma-70 factor (ECF subfamily)
VGNLLDAEDVLQDAYVNAYRALVEGRFDGRSQVMTWLYRIVTNAGIDALRKRKPSGKASNDEPQLDGAVQAEARVALRELDQMLSKLSAPERAALVLVAVEGLSPKAAAEVLECSEGAIEQRLVRARAALRAGRKESEVADV